MLQEWHLLPKMKKNKFLLLILFCLFFVLPSCQISFINVEIDKAKKSYKEKEYKKSIYHFSRVIKRSPESSQALEASLLASRISIIDLKDYESAIEFLNHTITYSSKKEQRVEAQTKKAQLYFEKLLDYKNSILAYNKLIQVGAHPEKEYDFRVKISKSYYYLNNFDQSLVEAKQILKLPLNDEQKFEVNALLGNIYFTNKNTLKAVGVYSELMKTFPEKAIKENIYLNLVICYEDLNEFAKAIQFLKDIKKIHPDPDYIDSKIAQLEQRKSNLPGAHGLRK